MAFGIEGCIKADAMLSVGWAVFSVPSVTLWYARELSAFAPVLREKTVFIIPDNDIFNPEAKGHTDVKTQALFCRTFLRRLRVRAMIAAPPFPGHKGIDDYLGHGGIMADLVVLDRETAFGLLEWLGKHGVGRRDRLMRNAEVLQGLSRHADSNGELYQSVRAIARIMNLPLSRVQRALEDLQAWGAVEIEGDLKCGATYFDRKENRWVGWEWEERPIIRLHPELRARDRLSRLGDW